jgi:hypothetical protein
MTRAQQQDRYAWLRPLELMWVARTIALADDWRDRSLTGQRCVRPWYEFDDQASDRFGMSADQFRAYRQTGMYGGYRVVLRRWPGMTVSADGWTPGPATMRLARWLNGKLGSARPSAPSNPGEGSEHGPFTRSAKRGRGRSTAGGCGSGAHSIRAAGMPTLKCFPAGRMTFNSEPRPTSSGRWFSPDFAARELQPLKGDDELAHALVGSCFVHHGACLFTSSLPGHPNFPLVFAVLASVFRFHGPRLALPGICLDRLPAAKGILTTAAPGAGPCSLHPRHPLSASRGQATSAKREGPATSLVAGPSRMGQGDVPGGMQSGPREKARVVSKEE